MTWGWLLLALKRLGWAIIDNWKVVLIGIAGLVLLIWIVGFFRSCGGGKVQCDEQCLQKVNDTIDAKRDAAIEKVMVDNGLVEKSVNDRSAESERRIEEAAKKVAEAKQQKGNITAEELEKLLLESK